VTWAIRLPELVIVCILNVAEGTHQLSYFGEVKHFAKTGSGFKGWLKKTFFEP
jgi:hypothetical protein